MEESPGSPKQRKRVTFSSEEPPSRKTGKLRAVTIPEAKKAQKGYLREAKKYAKKATRKRIDPEDKEYFLKKAENNYAHSAQVYLALYRCDPEKFPYAFTKAKKILADDINSIGLMRSESKVPAYTTRVWEELNTLDPVNKKNRKRVTKK
jgi:hypothetical protein